MHETNIRSLDLNLLIALKVLLEERHVSRAAERIHLSQPAMSRALGRLRDMFNDPLLVKSQHGLVLTDRASQLLAPLQSILDDVHDLVTPPFSDPSQMEGEITIATRDNEMVTIMPHIIREVAQQAPQLRLNILPLKGDDFSLLMQHQVDFILSGTQATASNLYRFAVCEDSFVCLVDEGNPVSQSTLSLEKYVQMKHCLVSIANVGRGLVDELLAEKNLERNVFLKIAYFSAVPQVILNTDLIITLPERLGRVYSEHYALKCLQPPLEIPKFQMYLYWHPKHHHNPKHEWIRSLFRQYR